MQEKLTRLVTRLKSEILAEMKLLEQFSDYLEKIKADIQQKEWVGLESKLKELDEVSVQISGLEQIRHQTFTAIRQELGLPESAHFQRVITALDFKLRTDLAELHNQLKIKVLKVKIEYQNLGYYLRNISGFIYRFLEEVFPHTRGKIYSRHGKAAKTAPASIMINKEL